MVSVVIFYCFISLHVDVGYDYITIIFTMTHQHDLLFTRSAIIKHDQPTSLCGSIVLFVTTIIAIIHHHLPDGSVSDC